MSGHENAANFTGLRLLTALIAGLFFAMLTAIAAYFPFGSMSIQSKAAAVVHGIIDVVFTSWLGESNTVLALGALTIIVPILCALGVIKSYPERQARKAMANAYQASTPSRPSADNPVLFGQKK